MEKYVKAIILASIIIGLSVGSLVYNEAVVAGEPFVQVDVYGEFDYVKVSNREFTMYLAEPNLHYRESLGWVSVDYQEIDVIVVIDGIKYERSMFCYKEESSELNVESVTIIFSYYMEENVFTFNALASAGAFAILVGFATGAILWMLGGISVMYADRVTAKYKE